VEVVLRVNCFTECLDVQVSAGSPSRSQPRVLLDPSGGEGRHRGPNGEKTSDQAIEKLG
jgi:hypothetical protein